MTHCLSFYVLSLVAVGKGKVIAAGWSGKVKTASTMVGICVWMAFPGFAWLSWFTSLFPHLQFFGLASSKSIAVTLTLVSGLAF